MLQQKKNLAQKLKLNGLLENIDRRCAEFESGNLTAQELISLLLSDEDMSRNNKRCHLLESRA